MASEFQWRVTKYDPAFRDSNGSFSRDEWTAISDVGRIYEGVTFSREMYLAVESAYVESALRFVKEAGEPALFACDVEYHGDKVGPVSLAGRPSKANKSDRANWRA